MCPQITSTLDQFTNFDLRDPYKYYSCNYCHKILDQPYQITCGCRYCFMCLQYSEIDSKCRGCYETLDSKESFKDKAIEKMMKNEKIKCTNCEWTGQLNELNFHRTNCKSNQGLSKKNSFDSGLADEEDLGSDLAIENKCFAIERIFEDLNSRIIAVENNKEVNNCNPKSNIQKVNEVQEQLNELKIYQNTFENDFVMYSNENVLKNFSDLQNDIIIYNNDTNYLQESVLGLTAMIGRCSERMRLLENSNHNGEKIIKIDNVKNKLDDASRNATTIDSDPFYTSRNGYKICGRIVFNVNPQDKQVYLSVFITIMKGEFDALLEWPFKQRITFMIIDQLQTEHSENIVDSFQPDTNSISFQKPISDMNIASGIPLFCSIGRLNSADHEYIKDDTMFVKIIVDRRYLHEI